MALHIERGFKPAHLFLALQPSLGLRSHPRTAYQLLSAEIRDGLARSGRSRSRLKQMHLTMVKHFNAGERLEYFKLNQAINSAIVAAAGNDVLMTTHEMLQARVKRARLEGHSEKRWPEAVGEHEEMIVALNSRNASALAEVLGRHMSLAFERDRYLFDGEQKRQSHSTAQLNDR